MSACQGCASLLRERDSARAHADEIRVVAKQQRARAEEAESDLAAAQTLALATFRKKDERADRLAEALRFIESASLFHPDAAWPDELKAALRSIGKMAHEALLTPTPPAKETT